MDSMLGVWMWPESIRLRKTEAVFDACRRAGVTDVFFLTKGLNGTTAFHTPLAPAMDPERDLLRDALEAAHERGIRLHAWFTAASDRHYLKEHPEAGLVHYTKGPREDIVSITDAAYADFLSAVLADMLDRYDPDGVHLDYIRYNHLICGWSEDDRRRYREAGADLGRLDALMTRTFLEDNADNEAVFNAYRAGDRDAVCLASVRSANVCRFAGILSDVVRGCGRKLTLSMALMPEGSYDDTAFADLHYGQVYGALSRFASLYLPMSYSQAYGKGADWVAETAAGTLRHGVKTLVGVQAYEGGTGLTLHNDLRAVEKSGAAGACLFREGGAVWAFRSEGELSLLNPFPVPVAACLLSSGEKSARIEVNAEPFTERSLAVPFRPETVRAWDENGREVCVLTVG